MPQKLLRMAHKASRELLRHSLGRKMGVTII